MDDPFIVKVAQAFSYPNCNSLEPGLLHALEIDLRHRCLEITALVEFSDHECEILCLNELEALYYRGVLAAIEHLRLTPKVSYLNTYLCIFALFVD